MPSRGILPKKKEKKKVENYGTGKMDRCCDLSVLDVSIARKERCIGMCRKLEIVPPCSSLVH